MKQSQTILVVDDEPTIREVVRRYLERDGYQVEEAADGQSALTILSERSPDLLVLDIMLPGIDGLTITRRLRGKDQALATEKGIPIIMLTARTGEHDRIEGLELGADDYVTKPFSPQELVARVRAVLRRMGGSTTASAPEQPLQFERLWIDPRTREVLVDGGPISLTAKEFDMLWFLANNPRQVFTRDQLLDQIWGYEFYGDPSTVTVHVRRLREKIEPDPAKPIFIQTVWGVGYKFEAGEAS